MHSRRQCSRAFLLGVLLALLPAADTVGQERERDIDVEIGIGYDDNPFLTPDEPYFDQFDQAVVQPNRDSGFYVPVKITGDHRGTGEGSHFTLSYRLRGDAYPGSDTGNADETFARLAPGFEWVADRRGRRVDVFFVEPFLTYNKEVFFDRDTGVGQVVSSGDASNRYSYRAVGAEVGYRAGTGRRVRYEATALLEQRDYEDVIGISSLDHGRWRVKGEVDFILAENALLSLEYGYQVRDYDERLARGLDGTRSTGNPTLQYSYHSMEATLRVKPVPTWTLYLDADLLRRDDDFVGYNDYDRPGFGVRSLLRSKGRLLRLGVRYRDRDYDNAFIFDMPVNPGDGSPNPNKAYQIWDLDLRGELPLKRQMKLFVDLDFREQETTDPRYAYDRARAIVGLEWDL